MANIREIILSFRDKPGGIIEAYHAVQRECNYLPKETISIAAEVFRI